jgi:Ser/Thr protein kinase RdoA (MazF antagonist)
MKRMAEALGLGPVLDWRPMSGGEMNLSWRLTTPRGVFAVKQLRDRTPDEMRPVLELLPRLAAKGFPVPRPYGNPIWIEDHWYVATGWLDGQHPAGLPLGRCADLGELVGRLHRALAELCPPAPARVADVPETVSQAESRLSTYARKPPTEEFDRRAQREIAWRREMLEALADQRPGDGELEPCGWTHGDLQPFNLLVGEDGSVTGVLDWDRLGIRPYGLEVVRTATITFDRSLDRIAAFVRGYRAQIPITAAQLADAADRRWWTLLTEEWPLNRHYDDNDRTCDHLFFRRADYLRWWTAHRAAVAAALTSS